MTGRTIETWGARDRSAAASDTLATVADYPVRVGDSALQARLESAIDVEGKIPRALDALGPVAEARIVLLDADVGVRRAQLEKLGGQVNPLPSLDMSKLPAGEADLMLSLWAGFRAGSEETDDQVDEAARVLRPGGRLLLVQDYGRDDVSRLRHDEAPAADQAAWSRRDGWFLTRGFKVRVLHCWWTFESIESARELLEAAFGPAGAQVADGMRRPRLEYKVAVYHQTLGAPSA